MPISNKAFDLLKILVLSALLLFHLPGYTATERMSIDSLGAEANGNSYGPAISSDGRYVAFYSYASNLTPDNILSGNSSHIFVHDRDTGITEHLSTGSLQTNYYTPVFSAQGRFVAYQSNASGRVSIYVWDRVTNTTENLAYSNGTYANHQLSRPALNADGRFVAFHSTASNLVPDDTNNKRDIFVRDRTTGATERISVTSDGAEGNKRSEYPSISSDGQFVVFESHASDLVGDDNNAKSDIFIHNRTTNTTERINLGNSGIEANRNSGFATISADGRFVTYESHASNLVTDDTNEAIDIMVHDRATQTTERISLDSNGNEGNGNSYAPSISADGRFVAFYSYSTNLVPADTNGTLDVFVRDRHTGETRRVLTHDGDQIASPNNSDTLRTGISADGGDVVFTARANDLVANDTNNKFDIFVDASEPSSSPPYLDLTYLPDTNANGSAEIATLRVLSDGTARVIVKDSQTHGFVSQINFNPMDMSVAGLAALQDINGNGSPEVALLLVKPDGRGRVYIKDAVTTQWVTNVNFLNPDWHALAISALDLDGDGVSEIAVLGARDDASSAAIQVIDSISKTQVKWFHLPQDQADAATRYSDLTGLGDANANGKPDLAALRTNADGSAQVVVLDGSSRETLNEIRFEGHGGAASRAVTGLPDLDGNTAPEVAVLGVAESGNSRVLIKDAASGEQTGQLEVFDLDWSSIAISSADDSQVTKVTVLGERDDQSATSAVVFDVLEQFQLDRIPFAASAE